MYFQQLRGYGQAILDDPLFMLGDTQITLWTIGYFVVLTVALFYVTSRLQRWLVNRLLSKTALDLGVRQAIGSITRYLIIFLGLLLILQSVGINLTTLNVLAGAIGIGVGFGLQNIASNFISGLIILFERPVKIGDRIEVGNVDGDVTEIGARSTKILTGDNIAIIIPNSTFITGNVVNWSYHEPQVRLKIPVGVSYHSDVRLVEKLLLEVARQNPHVLPDPPPVVWFKEFGTNALIFELKPWTRTHIHRKGQLISELNFAIHESFKKHNIEVPFASTDLEIWNGTPPAPPNNGSPPSAPAKVENGKRVPV